MEEHTGFVQGRIMGGQVTALSIPGNTTGGEVTVSLNLGGTGTVSFHCAGVAWSEDYSIPLGLWIATDSVIRVGDTVNIAVWKVEP